MHENKSKVPIGGGSFGTVYRVQAESYGTFAVKKVSNAFPTLREAEKVAKV
jgi:hypothetical protein